MRSKRRTDRRLKVERRIESDELLADAELAVVEVDKWPNSRTKPQTARSDELVSLGDNLWLHRLRSSGICPTTRWAVTPRRDLDAHPRARAPIHLESRKRDAGDLVAVLDVGDGLSASAARSLAERLGVRGEPSPSNFDAVDARLLCEQLRRLHPDDPGDAFALRHVLKPAYRVMFELLSGHAESSARGDSRRGPTARPVG